MKVDINITKKDIEMGRRGDPEGCPIHRAFGRQSLTISVGRDGLYLVRGKKRWKADVPDRLMAFIRRFDKGQKVKAFAFTMDVPTAAVN